MGQLTNAINNRPQGTLPSNTKPNSRRESKEPCSVVFLQSGKEVGSSSKQERPQEKPIESESEVGKLNKQVQIKDAPITHPLPPFPQRFQKQNFDV